MKEMKNILGLILLFGSVGSVIPQASNEPSPKSNQKVNADLSAARMVTADPDRFLTAYARAQAKNDFAKGARSRESKQTKTNITEQVVREICGKKIALLGESPTHGFGKTLQFKVELTRRLIDQCHFNGFFIESGIYDFLNIEKRLRTGQEVTESMVAAAIGGIWANREVRAMIPFLLLKAKQRRVTLGGIDDQLGAGTYAQLRMPADLVSYLEHDRKSECLSILKRHMLWQYTKDSHYSAKDKAAILKCVDGIETEASKPQSRKLFRDYDIAMTESLRRSFARDFRDDVRPGINPDTQDFNDRDRSMYLNFQWLMSRLPVHSKVIVWAANNHVAKSLSGVAGQDDKVSMGSFIRREFKGRAFAVGFSAYGGSYRTTRHPMQQLRVAPPDSLEAEALKDSDSEMRFLNLAKLRKHGAMLARPTSTDFKLANWSEVFDGIVIFREERPPELAASPRLDRPINRRPSPLALQRRHAVTYGPTFLNK